MPACFGRQGARCCAILSLFLLAAAFGARALAADEGGGLSEVLGIPRILHNPQYDEISVAPKAQAEASSSQSRGRAAMEERVKVVKRASSSKLARKAAVAALPLDKMSEAHRGRVLQIVNGNGMFRELPSFRFEVDPRVYYFFMKHPDVAVSIWRVMQISEFQMHQTGADGYETDDSDGTSGIIDVAYRGQNEVVVLCNGVYRSPLLPKSIKANGVLHVQVAFERDPNGKIYATHTARLFVLFPSQTIDTVARIMSPVSNAIIDQNFREVSLFLHMMSTAMERQPGWVENVSSRLDGVLAERRTQLMEVTIEVFADANPGLVHVPRRSENRTAGDEVDRGIAPPTRTANREEPASSGSDEAPGTVRE
ncbi:MAG TPA: hypothetical protein VMR25_07410 [Planctomycetaceae bacterium]|jgi:hypothetical protein|nr:hypothetical protein [Planctomycetaceae bacterium]